METRFADIPDVSGIYIFRNTINGKCYIGQSVNIRLRFAEHRRKRNLRTNLPLYRAVAKYGWDAFSFQILEVIGNSADLQDRECFWISFFRSSEKKFGYNICTEPHKTTLGRKRPKTECVAISDHAKTRVGELNGFFGKSHSAETKRKISEANKGAKRSVEHISKLHQAAWAASSKKVAQRCKESGEIIRVWDSCGAASRGTGVSITSINQCALGKRVSKRFGWEYI